MKRSLNGTTTAFVLTVGGLKLFCLLLGAAKPHLSDGAVLGFDASLAAAALAPAPEVRRGGAGDTGGSGAHHSPRLRLNGDRRDTGPAACETVQVTSSSR